MVEIRIDGDKTRNMHYNPELSEIHLCRGDFADEELEMLIERLLSHEIIHHVLHKLFSEDMAIRFDRVARRAINAGRGDIAFGFIDEE